MRLDLTDVCTCENREVTKEVTVEAASFDSRLGVFPIIEKKPFDLHMVNRENKELQITGETDVKIAIPCDRCLETVPTAFHLVFDETVPLEGADETSEEMEDTDYMEGVQLDVDRLVYHEILVNWPMKVLCREDCRGICKKCGTNLNREDCGCSRTELDPRMAAIQDIFNKFKEV